MSPRWAVRRFGLTGSRRHTQEKLWVHQRSTLVLELGADRKAYLKRMVVKAMRGCFVKMVYGASLSLSNICQTVPLDQVMITNGLVETYPQYPCSISDLRVLLECVRQRSQQQQHIRLSHFLDRYCPLRMPLRRREYRVKKPITHGWVGVAIL